VSLEASWVDLSKKFASLEETLGNLHWAVVEGQPKREPGHTLVDHYEAATNDSIDLVREAKEAVAHRVPVASSQLPGARQALITCQGRFNQLLPYCYNDLVSFDRINDLHKLAHERGGEWAEWVQGVEDALGPCLEALYEVSQSLLRCWQDLAESINR